MSAPDDDTTYTITWEMAVSHKATLTGAQIRERFGMDPEDLAATMCDEEYSETRPLRDMVTDTSATIAHPPVLTGVVLPGDD